MTARRATARALAAGACLLAGACSGGGSGGGDSIPPVTVSFALAGASVAEGAAPLQVQVVLRSSIGPTSADTSVQVVDAGTGSATNATDYATFAPQMITFPAGSDDGAVQTFVLTPLDDHLVEGTSETVQLGLANASGAAIQGISQHVVTITDVHEATIEFTATASSTPDESNAPRTFTVTLDLQSGVALGTTARARITDIGGGSASSGSDYGAFAPVDVSFPAASADGATRSITLQVLDDATVEADESVRFGVAALSSGTRIGAKNVHQLTITDDDSTGVPTFAATWGPNGTENALAYDALLDLGAQGVGAGSNTGTRVRITNLGGSPFALAAPRVLGAHANDFDVELENAPLPPAPAPVSVGPDVLSPLQESAPAPGPGLPVALDLGDLAALSPMSDATLQGFPIPGVGDVALEISRVELPIASDAILRVDGVDQAGGLRSAVGDLTLWSGRVRDYPGSHVFLALTTSGSRGVVDLGFGDEAVVHVVPDANASAPGLPVGSRVVRAAQLAAMGVGDGLDTCSEALEVPGRPTSAPEVASTPETGLLATANCRLAIETDYQLYQKFNSTTAVTNYVTQLIAAVSDRYFHDVQATLSIAYLGIYSNASDPWTAQDSGGNSSAVLAQFRGAWAGNWPASANLAHFISGANLGGGVAYVNVLCDQSYGFGVSGNISGSINWGSWSGAPGSLTWDFVVVAHEIGHNFGSAHTHAFCPPLDHCYSNCDNTTSCTRGTIMSYCHTCGSGMSNIDLEFHPVCANVMRQAVNASCLGRSALGGGQHVQYRVRFNPLTTTGSRSATLEFGHDATNVTQPFRVQLQGTAN